MNASKTLRNAAVLFSLLAAPRAARADIATFDSVCKGHIVSIDAIPGSGVLYKPESGSDSRGVALIVQNPAEQTHTQSLEVRNARCEVIATFGVYDAGHPPYGARYYTRTGGTGQDGDALLALAKTVGSDNILIQGTAGKWMLIKDPSQREGAVHR